MKPGLKRIKATLYQLGTQSSASYPESAATRKAHAPQTRKNRTYSFEIRSSAQKRKAPDETVREGTLFPSTLEEQAFPEQQSDRKAPTLPKFKSPRFSSHSQVANPALAMNLLQETRDFDAACEAELQQIVRQIEDIYLEGPIVDGWLESYPRATEAGVTTLGHGSVDRLMDDYVEEVCSLEQGKVTCESPRAGYRLCGLDAAGQMWSHPCPLEQLPSVSIAIGRYQKLRQLLERKRYLENRLSQMQDLS